MQEYDHLCKILVIGDSGVGKTCFLDRFVDDVFLENHLATIGVDFKIKTVVVAGKRMKLQMWDTAGQERFKMIANAYYRGAHAIIVMFDLIDTKTFENVREWMQEIERYASRGCLVFLVGNKSDLVVEKREDGPRFAHELGVKYFEVSAKANDNVQKTFEEVAKDIYVAKFKVGDELQTKMSVVAPPTAPVEDNGCCPQ